MARSSLLGIDPAPTEAAGRGADRLGPGDSSDSGSDMAGLEGEDNADPGLPVDVALRDDQAAPLPLGETLASADDGDAGVRDGADIGVDRVFTAGQNEADPDDVDPDVALSLVDDASQNALDDEDEEEDADVEGVDENGQPRARKAKRPARSASAPAAGADDVEALPGEVDPADRRPGRD